MNIDLFSPFTSTQTMKLRSTIDKFGRVGRPISYDEHVDFNNKRLRFVADPVDSHESVNRGYVERNFVGQTMHKSLEERVIQLELLVNRCICLTEDGKSWDARQLRISNVAAGDQLTDASSCSQTCSYDDSIKKFRCGNRTFNLVESSANEPVVVASRVSNFGPLELVEYNNPLNIIMPSHILRWDDEKVTDGNRQDVVWDEAKKQFSYRHKASWVVAKRPRNV